MLCLHQAIKMGKDEPVGLEGNANLHYAKELAERGYVCIVPDYPYLGENAFDPYQNGYVSCTMGIVNHRRAVDVLQSLVRSRPDAHRINRSFARRAQHALRRGVRRAGQSAGDELRFYVDAEI